MSGMRRRQPVEPGEPLAVPRWAADMSRRRFLRTGTIGVAAAGALTAIPGLPALLGDAEADAPGASSAASAAAVSSASPALDDASGLTTPLTAHVSDLSGEISLFVEDRTVVVRDPALVARLLAAAR